VRASTRRLQGARRSRSVVSDGSDKSDPTSPSQKASSDRNGPVSEPITTTTARRFEAKRSDRYNEPPTSNLNNFKSSNQTQPGHPSELMTAAPVHPDRASPRSLSVPENSALAKPLLEAADKGQLHKVEELLNSGAPLGAADRFGLNALHKAASRGHTELVEVLLARGIDVKQVGRVRGSFFGLRVQCQYSVVSACVRERLCVCVCFVSYLRVCEGERNCVCVWACLCTGQSPGYIPCQRCSSRNFLTCQAAQIRKLKGRGTEPTRNQASNPHAWESHWLEPPEVKATKERLFR
jgi:hypothetical protein